MAQDFVCGMSHAGLCVELIHPGFCMEQNYAGLCV